MGLSQVGVQILLILSRCIVIVPPYQLPIASTPVACLVIPLRSAIRPPPHWHCDRLELNVGATNRQTQAQRIAFYSLYFSFIVGGLEGFPNTLRYLLFAGVFKELESSCSSLLRVKVTDNRLRRLLDRRSEHEERFSHSNRKRTEEKSLRGRWR
ncbi:uncharacterized protein LY79DRAFT_537572 [Colletotrichum navitas]|uniref:Secreted protein n=1 Tax=Colletotrichum navitas TaxID=681940 RepID=A0AAD8QBD3_9PEZI|nr:uncharacterized protein LY79DRAFT_537572 [Colletotrichum navitas]KAK1598587.1 hypothetical protein LY79DRAFT_537572 [Colletotrichum navitas]